jgi:hypothetical protein
MVFFNCWRIIKGWSVSTYIHFHPCLIFAGKAGAYQSGANIEVFSYGSLVQKYKTSEFKRQMF